MRDYNMFRNMAESYRKIRDEKAGNGDACGYNMYDNLYREFSERADEVDEENQPARKG